MFILILCLSVLKLCVVFFFFFSSRRRHTRYIGDWSSDVCSSDLMMCDVETAERQYILVVGPFAFNQADLEPFLSEKSFFHGSENRSFTRQPDVADAHFI